MKDFHGKTMDQHRSTVENRLYVRALSAPASMRAAEASTNKRATHQPMPSAGNPRQACATTRVGRLFRQEMTMTTRAIDALSDSHTDTNDALKGYREMSRPAEPGI